MHGSLISNIRVSFRLVDAGVQFYSLRGSRGCPGLQSVGLQGCFKQPIGPRRGVEDLRKMHNLFNYNNLNCDGYNDDNAEETGK